MVAGIVGCVVGTEVGIEMVECVLGIESVVGIERVVGIETVESVVGMDRVG